jgi:hypothetical protein
MSSSFLRLRLPPHFLLQELVEIDVFPANKRRSSVDNESRIPTHAMAEGFEETLRRVYIHNANAHTAIVPFQQGSQSLAKSPRVLQHVGWVRGLYLLMYRCGKICHVEKALAVCAMEEVRRNVGKHLQKNRSHNWFH